MRKRNEVEEGAKRFDAVADYLELLRRDPKRAAKMVAMLREWHKDLGQPSDWRALDREGSLLACRLMALKHDLTAGELKLRSIFSDGTDALHACRMMVKKFGFDAKALGLQVQEGSPAQADPDATDSVDLSKRRGDLTDAEEEWLYTIGFSRVTTVLETANTFNGSKQSTEFSYLHHTGWLVLATGSARWFYHTQHKRWIHPTKIVAEVERAEREKDRAQGRT